MIFTIETSKYYFRHLETKIYEKAGFIFHERDSSSLINENDHDCVYLIKERPTVKFESMKELQKWGAHYFGEHQTFIIDFQEKAIEIYDDYRE